MTRKCKVCLVEKPMSDFYDRSTKCKECICRLQREKRAAKPKKVRYKFSKESDISLEIINEYFRYERESGKFYWIKCAAGKGKVGAEAGWINDNGYTVITLGWKDFRAHRLVWFVEHGAFPASGLVVDHIDRNPANNRIENLRVVPQKLNAHNIVLAKKNNSTGLLGARRMRDRFQSGIHDPSGKYFHLGTFDTPEEAHAAYVSTKAKFYPEAVIA